jgi:hypothetical protein
MPAPFGSTVTQIDSLKFALDRASPNNIDDLLRLVRMGTLLYPLKRTFTGLTGAATYNLTSLDATGETAGVSNPNRLAVLACRSLRVTAATTANTVGSYILTDIGGTLLSPTASTVTGHARISDDGTTISFITADVTAFTIQYIPRTLSAAQMDALFPPAP